MVMRAGQVRRRESIFRPLKKENFVSRDGAMPHETKHTQKGGEGSWCDWNGEAMELPDVAGRACGFTQAAWAAWVNSPP